MKYNCEPDHIEREIIQQIRDLIWDSIDEVEQFTHAFHNLYNIEDIKIWDYKHPADYCGEARLEFLQLYAEAQILREQFAIQLDFPVEYAKSTL